MIGSWCSAPAAELGGISEDIMNKELKELLSTVGIKNGATIYTLRSSVTTAMARAKLPHLEMRYLTSHSVKDILNEYTSLDPVSAMQQYFSAIRPLLTTITERAKTLGLLGSIPGGLPEPPAGS